MCGTWQTAGGAVRYLARGAVGHPQLGGREDPVLHQLGDQPAPRPGLPLGAADLQLPVGRQKEHQLPGDGEVPLQGHGAQAGWGG